MIHEHLTTFAGLPVRPFEGEALRDPEKAAWCIAVDAGEFFGGGETTSAGERVLELSRTEGSDRIRALVIGAWDYEGGGNADLLEALVEASARFSSLRAIFLGDIVGEEQEISWIVQGDVTKILEAYPQLEVFRARGSEELSLRPFAHDALRELAFETGGLPAEVCASIAASSLPSLEHLELWLGGFDYQRTTKLEHLGPLLRNEREGSAFRGAGALFPKLRYLGLKNASDADAIAALVADAPILAQLSVLDLSMGTLGDEGGEALAASKGVKGLERLVLSHHYLSDAVQDRLRKLGPRVELDDPQGLETDPDDRYVVVSE